MALKKMELDIINPNCAGIDIGSKSQYVAVGQALEDVKEFGVYAEDLTAICLHLKAYGIKSVAMENTGNYWQNLNVELEKHGMEVTLCNGKFTKHAKGSNRLKIALCHAVNAIGNLKDTHLSDFFRKITYRKDRATAVSATARKLAVIIWNMISKRVPYNPPIAYLFLDQKRKLKLVSQIKKNIVKFDKKPDDVEFCNSLNLSSNC